jgi:hypothetical protein
MAVKCNPADRSSAGSRLAARRLTLRCLLCSHLLLPGLPARLPRFATAPPAVRGLLLDSRKAQSSNYVPAVAEGVLAVRAAAGGDQQGQHAAGLAAAAGQQAQVAMLCLERLIALGECCCLTIAVSMPIVWLEWGKDSLSLPACQPAPAGPCSPPPPPPPPTA